jgi:hypothetical protein
MERNLRSYVTRPEIDKASALKREDLLAVANRREKVAWERSADLARSNDALRRVINRLAREPSLSAFLGFLLLGIATGLGCSTATFTTYDPSTNSFESAANFHDGVVADVGPM